jgi:hypothetical protein
MHIEKKVVGNYIVVVEHDPDPQSPADWDNFGTLKHWHNRYSFGDGKITRDEAEDLKADTVWLPVYMYDHSGCTINTTGFSCGWDSGQVGIIYADKDQIKAAGLNPDDEEAVLAAKKKKGDTENYNVKQSKIAIGSGGFAGKGFMKGTQTQGDFVPEQHTDFIFTSLGENFGFIGTTTLMLLYMAMLLRMVFIAERQRSTFSRVYAYSVAGILFFHIAINIGMTIGLAPVIGITLPLMSYGGSSLLTFTVLIFIMIKLDADRQMVLR